MSQIYLQEFSSLKTKEEDSKDVDLVGSLSAETLHLSEMIYQCEWDKFEILRLQFIEFERVVHEVLSSLNTMQHNLGEINSKIPQKSLPEILKCNFLIEELHKLLNNNALINTLKNLGKDICDGPISENMKNKIIKKEELIDSTLVDIRSLMSDTDENIKKFLQLWKEYENASSNVQLFVSEQNRLVSIFSGNVSNDEYLNYSVTVFEELSQNIRNKKDMMEVVNVTSSKLKENISKDCHIIINENLNSLTLQLSELEKSVDHLLAEHTSLKADLSDYYQSHHALTEWISNKHVEVCSLQPFKLRVLELLEVMTEESNTYENRLPSLLAKYDA
ncbi:hypothetical protein JTE90_025853 [Oedothorax gibbosus]|uniref:Uncharacterized protein n=1 Tax=Oedothorax gibbosus TaxID=931172 RepID=A0AAV6UNM3_9ARAC|nr:hypothetical protein JTE90_025853 [Oedothorax gibbosus]